MDNPHLGYIHNYIVIKGDFLPNPNQDILKDKRKICLHVIGGRGGFHSFPECSTFKNDMISVLYDADADCVSHIIEQTKEVPSQLVVLPYCIGSDNKKIKFNINYDPYTSSLLQANPDFGNYYIFNHTHDYILSDVCKSMETVDLEVKTLDRVVADQTNVPPPDFLSVDTQGSEYDILQGAQEILSSNVMGLVLEVEFQQLYTDQKLFGDICRLLADKDFEFVKFFDYSEFSPYRGPIGLRADGFQLSADALFLRKCDSIDPHDENGQIKLCKLAFFSILFNQIEYAIACMNRLGTRTDATLLEKSDAAELKYLAFIQEFKRNIAEVKPRYPPTFPMLYSYVESKTRFDTANKKGGCSSPAFFVKKAGSYICSKSSAIKRMLHVGGVLVHAVHWRLMEIIPSIRMALYEDRYTRIELLFKQNGLTEQAETLRSIRKKQLKQMYKFPVPKKK